MRPALKWALGLLILSAALSVPVVPFHTGALVAMVTALSTLLWSAVLLGMLAAAGLLVWEVFRPAPPAGGWDWAVYPLLSFAVASAAVWLAPHVPAHVTGWPIASLARPVISLVQATAAGVATHSAFVILREYVRRGCHRHRDRQTPGSDA